MSMSKRQCVGVQQETDFMKKTPLFAAALCALASGAYAQTSNVQLYGIVDSGVRVESNGGTAAAPTKSVKTVTAGGMSQSRLGLNVNEDLGTGYSANVNMEHRFNVDTGAQSSPADFWRQSWVGLTTPYGQVRAGRQYNVLFDVTTSTFASFKYSPYIEAFKPELGMALSARNSNLVKYVVNVGGFRGALAYSPSEGAAGASQQGYVRYETGPFAGGYGMEVLKDAAGNKVTASVFGGAFTSGQWVVSGAYGVVDPDSKYDRTSLASLPFLANGGTNGFLKVAAANAHLDKRKMLMGGVYYQLTPQWNLGAHYWSFKQDSMPGTTDAKGTGKMMAFVADYAFSKRTDLYLEADHSKFGDNLALANLKTTRTGYMVGIRHRF
jgi:predicted porin